MIDFVGTCRGCFWNKPYEVTLEDAMVVLEDATVTLEHAMGTSEHALTRVTFRL